MSWVYIFFLFIPSVYYICVPFQALDFFLEVLRVRLSLLLILSALIETITNVTFRFSAHKVIKFQIFNQGVDLLWLKKCTWTWIYSLNCDILLQHMNNKQNISHRWCFQQVIIWWPGQGFSLPFTQWKLGKAAAHPWRWKGILKSVS